MMTLDQFIQPVVTFLTLVYIGFCVMLMNKPSMFKILTGILGILIIGYGIYQVVLAMPSFIHQLNHPIDREIMSMYEVEEMEKTRRDIFYGLGFKILFIALGIFDLILANRIHQIKNNDVRLWIKLPVILQLGIVFIMLLIGSVIQLSHL